ncbi:MAG: nucleotidyltransferase domain-containing protein [Candidatus Thorarchaeota archaeon]
MDATFRKYPELQNYLTRFSKCITDNLDTRSIILFGGIALDDFSKKYSDIDIVVVLKTGLSEKEYRTCEQIIEELMESDPVPTQLLYVYFIPAFMLDSTSSEFKPQDGLIYGNRRIRPIAQYPLSITDNFSIREKGIVLFGEDLRKEFPEPPMDCFWKMFIDSLPYIEEAVKIHPFQLSDEPNDHTTVNWLLYFPRLLYSLVREDLIGKSDSAFWFQEEYNNPLGEFLVELARCRQENTSVNNDRDLVLNSRRLVLFSLEKTLEIRGVHANLSNLASIDSLSFDFYPAIEEFKQKTPES